MHCGNHAGLTAFDLLLSICCCHRLSPSCVIPLCSFCQAKKKLKKGGLKSLNVYTGKHSDTLGGCVVYPPAAIILTSG